MFREKLLRFVRRLEDRQVLRLNRKRLAQRVRRMRDEEQYRKEQLYRAQVVRLHLRMATERGTYRSTRLRLLYAALPLRILHYSAYPDLYPPRGLPQLPPLPPNEPERVHRPARITWQSDIQMRNCPDLLITPPSRSSITQLKPVESPSSESRSFLADYYAKNPRKWGDQVESPVFLLDYYKKHPGQWGFAPGDSANPSKRVKDGLILAGDPRPDEVPFGNAAQRRANEYTTTLLDITRNLYNPLVDLPEAEKAMSIVRNYREAAGTGVVAAEFTKFKAKAKITESQVLTELPTSTVPPLPKPPKRKYRNADTAIMEDLKNRLEDAHAEADLALEKRWTRSKRTRVG